MSSTPYSGPWDEGFISRPGLPSLRRSNGGQSALYFARLRRPRAVATKRDYRRGGSPRGANREQVRNRTAPFCVIASSARPRQMASRKFASVPVYDDLAELDRAEQHAPPPAPDPSFAAAAGARRDAQGLLCPHCGSDHTVRWGTAHGLPRRRCVSCGRTFNILTNTPLARLRNKDRWLTFAGTLLERKSIRKSAAACGVSATTSSRWHHRFTNCSAEQRAKILGAIISAYSNAPALTGISEDASAANLQWCRELLP